MGDSYKKATKKSQYEARVNQLSSLGQSKSDFDEVLKDGIESAIGDFIERVHKNIEQADMIVTGKINDITIQSDGNTINVVGNPHLIYQSRGVNGSKKKLYDTPHSYTDKRPPIEPIIEWIKRRNINLVNEEQFGTDGSDFKHLSEDEQIEKVAWAISTKIFQEGFAPRDLYEKEIPQLIKDIQKNVKDFTVSYIKQSIKIDPRKGGKNRIVIK